MNLKIIKSNNVIFEKEYLSKGEINKPHSNGVYFMFDNYIDFGNLSGDITEYDGISKEIYGIEYHHDDNETLIYFFNKKEN